MHTDEKRRHRFSSSWKIKAIIYISLSAGTLFIITGCVLQFYGMEVIVDYIAASKRQMVEGNKIFEAFKKSPIMTERMTIFNVTNPDEVIKGEKPKLEEVGPYVFDHTWSRINLHEVDPDTWKYKIKRELSFDSAASFPRKYDDVMTTVDIVLMAVLQDVELVRMNSKSFQNDTLRALNNSNSPFYKVSLQQLFEEGIPINCDVSMVIKPLCNLVLIPARDFIWREKKTSNVLFALLHSLNTTDPLWYTADKGIKDTKMSGVVKTIGGLPYFGAWNGEECDRLDASDHFVPPLRNVNEIKLIFSQGCIKIKLESSETVHHKGMKLTRFQVDDRTLGSEEVNPINKCLCFQTFNGKKCPPHGFYDGTPCIGFPLLASAARFMFVDEAVIKNLYGDNIPKHEPLPTYVDIEPLSGVIISARKRLQFSIEINRYNVTGLTNFPNVILPIVLMEEVLDLPQEDVDEIKMLVDAYSWMELILYILIGMGFIIDIGALIWIKSSGILKSNAIELST